MWKRNRFTSKRGGSVIVLHQKDVEALSFYIKMMWKRKDGVEGKVV
jgi:hypothetical protein